MSFLKSFGQKIQFNRNEFSGSFGDIGTDFPLITGMILSCGLDVASTLFMYGAMNILTGLFYGIPMPVQPLKMMAVMMIAQKLSGNILYGAGLAIGLIMLFLSVSGLVTWITKTIPKSVIRGIQFGLGLQLALLACKEYIPAEGTSGYILAAIGFTFIISLLGNKRYPPALFVILSGIIYALFFKTNLGFFAGSFHFALPQAHVPNLSDILTGAVLLALPQIPLSLGNSILATRQIAHDFFPEKPLTVRKISFTYSLMNLINPFFSGIPVCHGSGGMAGHYTFGARTGGSIVIYGFFYLILGLFFSQGFAQVVHFFPKPILGIILVFEGWALMRLIKDFKESQELSITLLVGLIAVGLPYGYLTAMVIGTILSRFYKFPPH